MIRQVMTVAAAVALLAALATGCEDDSTNPLERDVTLSGTVVNKTSTFGPLIVEIDYNLRSVAGEGGAWAIKVHRDFFVDSLYAYVDSDENGTWGSGEPLGFLHSDEQPDRALSFHVRDSDVKNINITIE